jgi:hypothetical protein
MPVWPHPERRQVVDRISPEKRDTIHTLLPKVVHGTLAMPLQR